jgi:hypothetical protein
MLALGVSDEAAENTFCILMKPLIPPRKTLSLWAAAGLDAVPKIALASSRSGEAFTCSTP